MAEDSTTTAPVTEPLGNSTEARTTDGTLRDQGTPTTATETKPDATPTEPAKPTPPETYTFKAPDGKSYDQSLIDGATPIFRELGLDQAAADKLVAFYDKHAQGAADLAVKAV